MAYRNNIILDLISTSHYRPHRTPPPRRTAPERDDSRRNHIRMAANHPAAFLLENPLKLYRDCLRLADFLAKKQGFPREALRAQVTAPWRRNQHEKDPETYMRQRESAVRGLSNYMMYEASQGAMDGAPAFVPEDDEQESK